MQTVQMSTRDFHRAILEVQGWRSLFWREEEGWRVGWYGRAINEVRYASPNPLLEIEAAIELLEEGFAPVLWRSKDGWHVILMQIGTAEDEFVAETKEIAICLHGTR